MAVPEGQHKTITQFGVFAWTALVSLWAYLWMLIVYKFWTPDRVTLIEGLLTLLYLPVLVGVAYLLDAKPWQKGKEEGDEKCMNTQLYQVKLSAAHGLARGGPCTGMH